MSFRRWQLTFVGIVLASMIGVASFNFYMDPEWMFGHAHRNNDVQTEINERNQKVNRMYFQPFHYDSLLLGSSRSTYINQNDFVGDNVFNFAVSNISISEYMGLLDYAVSRNGKPFKTVYIGVDFFKSSVAQRGGVSGIPAYVKQISTPLYRYKSLFSLELFNYSKMNYTHSKADDRSYIRNYNRYNVATAQKYAPSVVRRQTAEKVNKFKTVFYGSTYVYNPNYAATMRALKDKYPTTTFVVFTTPVSEVLYQAMLESGRYPDYERWIRDLTAVFGEVTNFMTVNGVTKNWAENYFDGHHFYPHVGTMIAHVLTGTKDPHVPSDFGVVITKDTVDNYFKSASN